MRKLKLQVQMSLDGFIAGPNREMDWLTCPWTDDINQYVTDLTATVDTIVLGRKLAEGFIPYWAGVAADPSNPEQSAGKLFTELPKVVFTHTLDKSLWDNAVLAKGDLAAEISKLKAQASKDIIVYGGSTMVSALIKARLIDELHLFVNPVIIGQGMPIFQEVTEKQQYKLVSAQPFTCGITALTLQLS